MTEVLGAFPDSIGGHVEAIGQREAPLRCGGGFAPIIGDFDGLTVLEFGDADVAVEVSVAIVASPLGDDDVIEFQASTDF